MPFGVADLGRDRLHPGVVEPGGVEDDAGRVASGRVVGEVRWRSPRPDAARLGTAAPRG